MAKRLVSNFSRSGYPSYQSVDEEGQAKPCVLGRPWVNPDTLKTLARHGGKRTGPKGEAFSGVAPADRKIKR
jgi:hypothetical protein